MKHGLKPQTAAVHRETPLLGAAITAVFVVSVPLVLLALFSRWSHSPSRQLVGIAALAVLFVLAFPKKRTEHIVLAFFFTSQFLVSVFSMPLTPPATLTWVAGDVLLVLLVAAAAEGGERRTTRGDWFWRAALSLLLWIAIVTPLSAHVDRSLIFLLWQLKYILIYWAMCRISISQDLARSLLLSAALILLFQSGLGFAQYAQGGSIGLYILGEPDPARSELHYVGEVLRASGTLGATNAFGGLLSGLLVLLLPYVLSRKAILPRLAFGLGILALVMSLSRAGWLSFLIGSGVVIYRLFRTGGTHAMRVLVGTALIGGAVATMVGVFYEPIISRFDDERAVASAMGRVTQWEDSLAVVKRVPVTGIGPGVTEYFGAWNDYERYVRNSLPWLSMRNQVHSALLQFWIESGTPAAVLFVVLLGITVVRALKCGHEKSDVGLLALGASAAVLSLIVHINFGTEVNNTRLMTIMWFLAGIAASVGGRAEEPAVHVKTRSL